jgi:hypothetical protein
VLAQRFSQAPIFHKLIDIMGELSHYFVTETD